MHPPIDMEERRQCIQQWHNSAEYQQACQLFQSECERLTDIARQLTERLPQIQADCQSHTARRELASKSTLHRGFYCPSPVFELIVGNTKRGKILKRITSRSNPSHEYGFDTAGQLLWCKTLHDQTAVFTEYLVYQGQSIYGITVDITGSPVTITEEVYENGRLIRYWNGLCLDSGDSLWCSEITCEYYGYDDNGLFSCEKHHYLHIPESIPESLKLPALGSIPHSLYRSDCFTFTRDEDGYLSSFTNSDGYTYYPSIRRKA